MEKAKQFLEALKNDPKFAELMDREQPKTLAECIKLLAGMAKDLGHDVTEADFKAFFEKTVRERAEKSAAAEKAVSEADDELGAVAGGEETTRRKRAKV